MQQTQTAINYCLDILRTELARLTAEAERLDIKIATFDEAIRIVRQNDLSPNIPAQSATASATEKTVE